MLVLRGAWRTRTGRRPNSLLRNLGAGEDGVVRFEDVTEEAGLLSFHPTQAAAWGDYDGDGWLDLYIGNESLPRHPNPCQLYRNAGAGAGGKVTFTELAAEAGVDAGGLVKGVAWGDADNDGRLDLYVSRLLEPNLLFHNRGAAGEPRFREVGAAAGVTEPRHSFPTWFWDYDNDGWLDIFVSGYAADYLTGGAGSVAADMLGLPRGGAETPRLYRNLGAGGAPAFEDVTVAAGLDQVLLTMGSNFGDLDNDGFPDFYLGTGAPSFRALVPNRMFWNDGGRRFLDATASGGFGHLQKGHGVAFGDLDNDGDQDVYAVIGGAFSGDVYPNALFENPGHGNRWITLRLEGTTANRSAIGDRRSAPACAWWSRSPADPGRSTPRWAPAAASARRACSRRSGWARHRSSRSWRFAGPAAAPSRPSTISPSTGCCGCGKVTPSPRRWSPGASTCLPADPPASTTTPSSPW